ncbi:MAG: hypothetical protein OEU51_01875, partial [Gammaproteobacteria bacterium]|nr:hypothetical protein [Gammaproteobacteria bacterium]
MRTARPGINRGHQHIPRSTTESDTDFVIIRYRRVRRAHRRIPTPISSSSGIVGCAARTAASRHR